MTHTALDLLGKLHFVHLIPQNVCSKREAEKNNCLSCIEHRVTFDGDFFFQFEFDILLCVRIEHTVSQSDLAIIARLFMVIEST